MGLSSYSTTPASNTTISGINIAEGCPPSGINDAIRQLMADLATDAMNKNGVNNLTAAMNFAQGANIASAATTDIGAATGNYVNVTGATTITGLGTAQAGTVRWVRFTGALTLTHNISSLILPGAANILTEANDVACFVSMGSGNWFCSSFSHLTDPWLAPIYSAIQTRTNAAVVGAGTVDAITATFSPAITALTAGMTLLIRATGANTSTTPTLAVNGLAAKTIVKGANAALKASDIAGAGHWIEVQYDSTLDKFVLQNPATALITVDATLAWTGNQLGVVASGFTPVGTSVYQSTGTALTASSWTTLGFNQETYDDSNWHDNVTNNSRITVNFTGRIHIVANCDFGSAGNAVYALAIWKNGAQAKQIGFNGTGGANTCVYEISDDLDCTSGDYFEIKAYTNAAGLTTGVGADHTNFKARRIK